MKSNIFTLVLVLVFFNTSSQEIQVLDATSGQGLEFVSIYEPGGLSYLTTNSKGKANLGLLADADSLRFSLLGYASLSLSKLALEQGKYIVRLKRSSFDLNAITISATRWRQTNRSSPQRIQQIARKESAFQNPQTAADLLAVSGEVFIQKSQQGGGSPMIRGFSTNRLLYVVDGVRMNSAIFRSGNLQNVIALDPFAIESTEILFGPSSVIYGSDAIGGVMSFQSLRPQFASSDTGIISGSVKSRYSSASQEETIHADLNYAWKKWAFVSSFSRSRFGDLIMGINGPSDYLHPVIADHVNGVDVVSNNPKPRKQIPTAYSQNNFMQKIRHQASPYLDLEYGFHYSKSSDIDRYDRHLQFTGTTPKYGDWYYGPQVWMMNSLLIHSYRPAPLWDQFSTRLAYQNFEESRNSRLFGQDDLQRREEKVSAYSINTDFQKKLKLHTLSYGMELVINDVVSEGATIDVKSGERSKGPSRYPNSLWYSAAIYLSDAFKVSEKTTVQSGLRYNHFGINSRFDSQFYPLPFNKIEENSGALTASLGFVNRPTQQWVFSGNLSTGFRAPNVDDIGKVFDSEPGSVVVPNPELRAEYAYNAEIGFAHVIGNLLQFDGSVYYTWLEDAMVRRDFQLNGLDSIVYDGQLSQVQAIQNAANAWVAGFQVGIEAQLPLHLKLRTNFNYQKGEEELENGKTSPSRHVAPWFGSARLSFETGKWNAQFYLIANGEISSKDLNVGEAGKPEIYASDNSGLPFSPSWYTLNLKCDYQINSSLKANIGLENLSNQRYRPYSSGIAAPGLNFIASIQLDF